jgi:DNA-binding LacI/PurR family transcriptional regulator
VPEDLQEDLLARRLRGLISASCDLALYLHDWPAWRDASVPHVDSTGHESSPYRVDLDIETMVDFGLDAIRREGRRRVASIGSQPRFEERMRVACSGLGLPSRPGWQLSLSVGETDFERGGFRLMHDLWRTDEKPDAVFVSDDIAAKGVAQAILQLRVRVPEDLLVVTGANCDSGIFYPFPTVRVEFDMDDRARQTGELLLDLIQNPGLAPCVKMVAPHPWRWDDGMPPGTPAGDVRCRDGKGA